LFVVCRELTIVREEKIVKRIKIPSYLRYGWVYYWLFNPACILLASSTSEIPGSASLLRPRNKLFTYLMTFRYEYGVQPEASAATTIADKFMK